MNEPSAKYATTGFGYNVRYWCVVDTKSDGGIRVHLEAVNRDHAIHMVAAINREKPRDEYGQEYHNPRTLREDSR